jgi:hypothetical protein
MAPATYSPGNYACTCNNSVYVHKTQVPPVAVAVWCQGVHYGLFPGDPLPSHPHTVWNIIRPHNWRPTTEKEHLVQFDTDTGNIHFNIYQFSLRRLPTTHQVHVVLSGSLQ